MTEATSVASNGLQRDSASVSALQHNYSNIPSVQAAASLAGSSTSFPGTSSLGAFSPAATSFSMPPPIPSSAPPLEGAIRAVPSRSSTPPSERQRRREKVLAEEMRKSKLADIDDLIRLQGPLTEDAVLKTLQARFYNQKYQVGAVSVIY